MIPIPIGVDSFRSLRERGYYYVDKTRLITEFLQSQLPVTLITRPRRFGKTLCMDMVKVFFDIGTNSRSLFEGLEVMEGQYAREINSRPVLSFTFKDCKDAWPLLIRQIKTALKGNPHLDMALMTGIQRVAKENIFSGLNNLLVCTAESGAYADCFGFTEEETRELLCRYGMELSKPVRDMYDGYRFGGKELYNPWSILNYVKSGRLAPYWVNTSSNELIHERLEQASVSFKQKFNELILNGVIATTVDLQTGTYDGGGDAALWGLFVNAGYLTFTDESDDPTTLRRLRIPNGEVRDEFKEIVKTITSYHDARENAYHMLLLGMCVYLEGRYEIRSNQERGLGRSDILLKATRPSDWNIIVEFKQGTDLPVLAHAALEQISEKQYFTGLTGPVLLLGIAHSGKECELEYRLLD